jgi:hypothetical protein
MTAAGLYDQPLFNALQMLESSFDAQSQLRYRLASFITTVNDWGLAWGINFS